VRPSVHRPGLCIQRLRSADDQAHRNCAIGPGDWKLTGLGWIFNLAIFFLAAVATVPAYLRDMFGTRYVGAIHRLLLNAWSIAGIVGPVLRQLHREYNVTHGVAPAQAYNASGESCRRC
jgi:hypothetical protein